MRDMSQVLDLWGAWAASDNSGVDYSSIAAGFKGLLPQQKKTRMVCCDSDGLIIDLCISQLKKKRPEECELLLQHYYLNISKRKIAKKIKCDEKLVRIKIQMAEGFVDGCLSAMSVRLQCE